MPVPPWKLNLKPASFKGVGFHVDVDTRISGRRKHLHEFPKKEIPYLEDMGRKARVFTVMAYVIGPDYEPRRDALIEQLEAEGNGQLVHPTYPQYDQVGVDHYAVTERRQMGGWAEFEITFIEAGQDVSSRIQPDTQSSVNSTVDDAIGSSSVFQFGAGSSALSDFARTFMASPDITGLK